MAIIVAAEQAAVAAAFAKEYYIAALSLPLLALHLGLSHKGRDNERDLLMLSAEVSKLASEGRPVGTLPERGWGTGRQRDRILEMARRHLLGELDPGRAGGFYGQRAGELLGLLALRLEKGADIRKALSLLSARLERRIRKANKLRAKVGGMKTLTMAGLVIFVPLFGGVSAGILGSSLGISGSEASARLGFTLIVAASVSMMLYISASFEKPALGILENLYSVMPFIAVSLFVLLLSGNYAANLI